MNQFRVGVPNQIKRALRQEAGFGCCICGHPFVEYHHIVPWAEDQHFRVDDMMVLCGNHHALCTVGALSAVDQRKAKARPINVVNGFARGQLFVNNQELVVRMGAGVAVNMSRILVLSGQTALGARINPEDGRVLVSALIHDAAGEVIASLTDNEWSMRPQDVWDFEVYPLHALVRRGPGDIAFGVDVRNEMVDLQGKWFHRGERIDFTPSEFKYRNGRMYSNLYVAPPGVIMHWPLFQFS